MINWKTNLTSGVSAIASFVLFAQELHYITFPPWAMAIAMFAMAGGLASFGIVAKDFNTTGGTNPQPSSLNAIQYKVDEHAEAVQVLNGAPKPVPVVVKPAIDMDAPLPPPTKAA